MATRAPEIQDRINQMEQLLERMRTAYDQAAPGSVASTHDVVEREPARRTDGPAHRTLVDPNRQFTDNMAIAGLQNPEAFGRNREGVNVVVKSSDTATDYQKHPGATGGIGLRVGNLVARRPQSTEALPPWERLGVTGTTVADALPALDDARVAATRPVTTGAVAEQQQAATQSPSTPEAHQFFDAAAPQTPNAEVTNANFLGYQPGTTGYDEWLAKHTPGLEVHSGRGKEISNLDYGVTVTQAAAPKPQR